jgi:DNA-binding LacI/PurR family transcriptional regulator
MAVTIKDVAAKAGVSPSTVSRVCNDHPSISRETREKVRRAMAALHYEPVPAVPQTPPGIKLIGTILPPSNRLTSENPFYLQTLWGISQFCSQRGYAATILTGEDEEEILRGLQTLHQSGQLEGVIMLYSKAEDRIVDCLCESGLLYVLIGKPDQLAGQTICIDNDNLLAGREAADYLYSLGHRKIAYVGCDSAYLYAADRKSGWQLSMLQNGLPVRPEYCLEAAPASTEATPAIRAFLEQPDPPTAVVVSDDILAVTLERTCIQMGLAVPRDLSVISFNNSPFAQLTSFQLTSVDINSFQLGFEAASQLINHVENPNLLATKIIVPHYIVERESCRRL